MAKAQNFYVENREKLLFMQRGELEHSSPRKEKGININMDTYKVNTRGGLMWADDWPLEFWLWPWLSLSVMRTFISVYFHLNILKIVRNKYTKIHNLK